jgi:peptidoglycan/xylan/chitin deacetylase (PgdA/CDA1 family)
VRLIFHHGLADEHGRRDYYGARNMIGIDEFRAQVRELARHWRVVSLAELVAGLERGEQPDPRAVHLSFDDGFASSVIAAEILDQARLPWTLFVVADAVLDGFRPGYIRLADAISAARGEVRAGGRSWDLDTDTGRWTFGRQAKAEIMSAPAAEQEQTLERIIARLHPRGGSTAGSLWRYLTPAELAELHRTGVEIGNHTARHANLSRCTDAQLSHEIDGAKARLERALAADVWAFAYPDGRQRHHVREVVARSHRVALGTWTATRPRSLRCLRRYPAGRTLAGLQAVLGPRHPFHHLRLLRRQVRRDATEAAYRWGLRRPKLSSDPCA